MGFMALCKKAATWPSPRSEDSESCGNHPQATDSLTGASRQWQTPKTPSGGNTSRGHGRKGEPLLDGQAKAWKTPHGFQAGNGPDGNEFAKMAKQWRTPDAPSGGGVRNRQGSIGSGHQTTIAEQAEHWPTPGANDQKGSAQKGQRRGQLDEATEQIHTHLSSSPPAPTSPDGPTSSPPTPTSRRRLNPAFVSWLMGWPIHWTAPVPIPSGPAATAWWRWQARSHLNACFNTSSPPQHSPLNPDSYPLIPPMTTDDFLFPDMADTASLSPVQQWIRDCETHGVTLETIKDPATDPATGEPIEMGEYQAHWSDGKGMTYNGPPKPTRREAIDALRQFLIDRHIHSRPPFRTFDTWRIDQQIKSPN